MKRWIMLSVAALLLLGCAAKQSYVSPTDYYERQKQAITKSFNHATEEAKKVLGIQPKKWYEFWK